VGPPGKSAVKPGGPDHAWGSVQYITQAGRRVTGFNARAVPGLLCTVADEPSHFPFAFSASIASVCAILSARTNQA
jgi:hypothetical protein